MDFYAACALYLPVLFLLAFVALGYLLWESL